MIIKKPKFINYSLSLEKSLVPSEDIHIQRKITLLKHLAHKVVCSGEVPKLVIACTVARIEHSLKYNEWKLSSTVPLDIFIEHRNENFELFSFPEYSQKMKSIGTENFGSYSHFN